MNNKYKSLIFYLAALVLLLILSLIRKSTNFTSADIRCTIVYIGYILLILLWMFSMFSRITQRHIRKFLLLEGLFMCLGMLIRFVQEAFLQDQLLFLRFCGLLVSATILPILLFGLYGSLGLGEGEGYTLPHKWYPLSIPVLVLTILQLTDNYHHFVFRLIPGEPYPNIAFHPYIGLWLMAVIGFSILMIRLICIYRRSGIKGHIFSWRSLFLIAEFPLGLAYISTYAYFSFSGTPEILEFFASLYFLEAISWELYILSGLIPVNTQYQAVFEHATLGMQIVDPEGNLLLRSSHSQEITDNIFRQLKSAGTLVSDNTEVCIYDEPDFSVIWQRDISGLQETVRKLKNVEAELIQENQLLAEEYRSQSQKARIAAQNRIYSQLSDECAPQLNLMQQLTGKCASETDNTDIYRMLLVIGTYIKRRCQLRLTISEDHKLKPEDVSMAYKDLILSLRNIGIPAELQWIPGTDNDAEFWICGLDFIEKILEKYHFQFEQLTLMIQPEAISCLVKGKDSITDQMEHFGRYTIQTSTLPDEIMYTLNCESHSGFAGAPVEMRERKDHENESV